VNVEPQAPQVDPSTPPTQAPQQPQAWPPQYQPGQQGAYYPQPGYQQPTPRQPSAGAKAPGGIGGAIAGLAIIGKLLLTSGSMFVSMWAWSYQFGWPFAIGFVLSIFCHECGHAVAGKMVGRPISAMVFVPLMGAFVLHKATSRANENAFIAIMGPVFGGVSGAVCLGIYMATHANLYIALAFMIALINLINLAPILPLDGSHIIPVFAAGRASQRDRITYAVAYPGVAILLVLLMYISRQMAIAISGHAAF